MRYLLILSLLQIGDILIVNRVLGQPNYIIPTTEISFESSDGITLYGDLAFNPGNDKTIILFHQSKSNVRGEYSYTLPILHNLGYNVLAVDLRNGGELYGSTNRTVNSLPKEAVNTSYCDSEKDVQASIEFASSSGMKKLILFGSSFSGSLVIRAASKNQTIVHGIVAFSPSSGGPMASCKPDEVLEILSLPLLVIRPGIELGIKSVAEQFKLIQSLNHQTYIAKNGIHGSSLLVPERTEGDTKDSWKELRRFLLNIQ